MGGETFNHAGEHPVNSLLFAYRVFAIFLRFRHEGGHADIAHALSIKDLNDHLRIANVKTVTLFATK